jgi:hypothetical protein
MDHFVFDSIISDMQGGYRGQGGEIIAPDDDDDEEDEVTGWAEDTLWED